MRRLGLNVGIILLTFLCGVAADGLLKRSFQKDRVLRCRHPTQPGFVAVSSAFGSDYQTHRYQAFTKGDPQEVTLYGNFTSAQATYERFEWNAPAAVNRIESGPKFDVHGNQIGKRGVTVFKNGDARIFWTTGDVFWSVQAPSFELARAFEASDIVQSITKSNNAGSGLGSE
jgi:hypothetical protein